MLNLRSLNRFILISLALFGLSVSSVNAITIDFESLSLPNNSVNLVVSPYVEDNFQFIAEGGTAPVFATFGTGHANFSGSTALFNTVPSPITLTEVGGEIFNLFSIDLSEFAMAAATITFTGYSSGLPVATDMWSLNGDSANLPETFLFNSLFANVDQVTWNQVSPFHQFDNLVINPSVVPSPPSAVPIPATVWLFGTALIGLIGFGKRRKAA
jgi:hypothetical protein